MPRIIFSGKIWNFTRDDVDVEIISDTEQQVTIKALMVEYKKYLLITMVYSECTELEGISLRSSIYGMESFSLPRIIRGDFNAMLNENT